VADVADIDPGKATERLLRRLPASCTQAEREAQAVSGSAILNALEKGQPVELVGVIVRGDVSLDRLPRQKTIAGEGFATKEQELAKSQELRLIRGAVVIRDSVVTGAVRHRSDHGMLRFEGPVDFHGTTFQEGVDLSRSIFHGPVELAGATFQKEAYFIQGRFMQTMNCQGTKFGPHTRFHRSDFHGRVDCAGALFDGLAEWLEVRFEGPVVFERARFGSGTGFSGGRFMQPVSFEESIFSRDAFFTFSIFEERALFAGAQFLGSADFSDADFRKPDDLAKARFDVPPLLTRTQRFAQEQPVDGLDSFLSQYGITAVCLLLALLLLVYIWKV
jgi:uncharacterized protein YjbI with pentapeptide repeats